MSGHGWVTPNPNGMRARCGGPPMCSACALEKAQAEAAALAPLDDEAPGSEEGAQRQRTECECPEFASGLTCGRAAMWLVQVGTRRSDAQLSCARHLSMTCSALYGADSPRKPALTVTAVRA